MGTLGRLMQGGNANKELCALITPRENTPYFLFFIFFIFIFIFIFFLGGGFFFFFFLYFLFILPGFVLFHLLLCVE